MAQLDVSIIFDQFCITIFCLYFFLHFVSYMLIRFWYSKRCRDMVSPYDLDNVFDYDYHVKRILNL